VTSGVDPASPYQTLGIPPSATAAEVRRAYRSAVRRLHPDVAGGGSVVALGSVVQAYRTLERAGALAQAGAGDESVLHVDVYA